MVMLEQVMIMVEEIMTMVEVVVMVVELLMLREEAKRDEELFVYYRGQPHLGLTTLSAWEDETTIHYSLLSIISFSFSCFP